MPFVMMRWLQFDYKAAAHGHPPCMNPLAVCVFHCIMYQSQQQILGVGATLPDLNVFACHTLSMEDFVMTVL